MKVSRAHWVPSVMENLEILEQPIRKQVRGYIIMAMDAYKRWLWDVESQLLNSQQKIHTEPLLLLQNLQSQIYFQLEF